MPDATITSPAGANRQVADFTTWVDGFGQELNYEQQIATYRANAACNRGDAVMFVAPTTTVPLSVTPLVGTTQVVALSFIGVALDPIAAGAYGRVAIRGYCRVNVGTAAPASYDCLAVNGSAAGAVAVVTSAALAATNVAGTLFGIFLGTKEAGTNLAPCRLARF